MSKLNFQSIEPGAQEIAWILRMSGFHKVIIDAFGIPEQLIGTIVVEGSATVLPDEQLLLSGEKHEEHSSNHL